MKKIRLTELYEGYIEGNPELTTSGSGDFAHVAGDFDPFQNRGDISFGPQGGGGRSEGGAA